MWGNKPGWITSAVIVAIFCAVVIWLELAGTTPSEMTPKFAAEVGNLQPLALPTAPETVVPMNDECDATPAYRQATQEWIDHRFDYEKSPQATIEKLTASDRLVEATHCKGLTIFTTHPEQVLNFDSDKEPITALRRIGEITAIRALALLRKGDTAQATKYAEAAFALGAKLFKERIVYDELEAGLGVMGAADHVLIEIAKAKGDTARANQVKSFDDARKNFAGRDGPLDDLRVITRNIDGATSGSRAGDVFYLAEKSPERVWRVEACFQLARMKHNVGDAGHASDQRHGQKILRRLADNDPDPIVRAAAAKARDMTDAEYFKQ